MYSLPSCTNCPLFQLQLNTRYCINHKILLNGKKDNTRLLIKLNPVLKKKTAKSIYTPRKKPIHLKR